MNRVHKGSGNRVQKGQDSFFIKCDSKNVRANYKGESKSSKPKTKTNFPKNKNDDTVAGPVKKPFDKKQWRTKKYSNKYKLEMWEDKRRKAVLRSYHKQLKHDGIDQISEQTDQINDSRADSDLDRRKKGSTIKKAHLEFQRIKEEKQKSKEEAIKRKDERKKAIAVHKKKKIETFKRLNKKTKKGQPIMKDRIELLLEKIQHSVNQDEHV